MAKKRAPRSRRWWRRPAVIITIVAVVVVAGAGTAAAVFFLSPKAATQRLVAAAVGTYDQSVSASGTIEPATVANLTFSSSGTVTAVDVQIGQTVTAGQALASIDPTQLQSQVTLAQAELNQAETQQTAAAGGTSAQVAAASAQVASAQAKLQLAQTAVSQATLSSPIAGVVAAVNVSVGAQIGSSGTSSSSSSSSASRTSTSTGTSSTSSTPTSSAAAITVISPTSWVVSTTVSNADLANIKTGMQAQVTPTGATQAIFGTVQSIGVQSTSSTAGVAQFPVTVALTGSPTGLYAGTVASVNIITKELDNVLTVPTAAVRTENGQTVVTVSDNGSQQTVQVTLGQIFGAQTQITNGLTEGQEVVVPVTQSFRTGSGSGGSSIFGGTGGTGGSGRSGGTGGSGTGGSGRTGSGSGSSTSGGN